VISLTDKIPTNNPILVVQQPVSPPILQAAQPAEPKQDTFVKSTEPAQDKTQTKIKDNKELTIAYAAGGIALVAGIACLVVRFRRGKGSSGAGELGNDLKNVAKKSAPNETGGAKPTENLQDIKTDDIGNKVVVEEKVEEQIVKEEISPEKIEEAKVEEPKIKEFHFKETEIGELESPEELTRLKEIDQQQIDQIIKKVQPKDEALAREVLPKLMVHSEKLGIAAEGPERIEGFEKYLNCINIKNKDYALEEGIALFAKKLEKIKAVLQDSYNAHDILYVLTPENKGSLDSLIDLATKFKFETPQPMVSILKNITAKSKDFITTDLLPQLVKNADEYKIKSGSDIAAYVKTITPENKNFAFDEVMPLILEHGDKLKIDDGYQIAPILGSMTPESIDAIKTVADNAEKLGVGKLTCEFLAGVTPENKACIPLVAEHAEELQINEFYDPSEFKELLDKGHDGILKELG